MNFHRFEHVNQDCKNLDATRQFYQTLFPDWYVRAEGEAYGVRWLHLGNDQFYLALNQSLEPTLDRPVVETCRINHIGFVIADSEQVKTVLDATGIEYTTYTSPETKLRIYVNDPDGTEIELVEYQADYALR
jgi:catechol 2,3-dioxygenase-like lactoylglutathione lyase family enzyme